MSEAKEQIHQPNLSAMSKEELLTYCRYLQASNVALTKAVRVGREGKTETSVDMDSFRRWLFEILKRRFGYEDYLKLKRDYKIIKFGDVRNEVSIYVEIMLQAEKEKYLSILQSAHEFVTELKSRGYEWPDAIEHGNAMLALLESAIDAHGGGNE